MSPVLGPDQNLRFPRPLTREIVIGCICWILSLEFFIGQIVAQYPWKTPYSLVDNSISDLGNTACGTWPPAAGQRGLAGTALGVQEYVCSPQHAVMNVSFIVTGVLIVLGVFFTRSVWPRRRLTTWGLTLLTLAGLGKVVVGLTPENVNVGLHLLGGLGIVCANVGILLLGLAVWRTEQHRWIARFSVLAAILGLIGGVLDPLMRTFVGHGGGAMERVADYPAIVWMAVVGVSFVLWSRAGEGHVSSSPSVASPSSSGPRT